MKNVKVLDCTLRDGGRCFGNMWGDEVMLSISEGLAKANVDIVEIGFIWYLADGICRENISHFRNFDEIKPFVVQNQEYAIYIEYTVYKRNKKYIPEADRTGISYIRLGLTKKEIKEASDTMKNIVDKGYKLFVQGINIFSYTEEELQDFIGIVNFVNPYAFAIVDTFGHMDTADIKKLYSYIDRYLNSNIAIAFHSHNNKGLSLELAKTLIAAVDGKREVIIDGTLLGIGMGGGNQKTELVCDFLNDGESENYYISVLHELIEKYIRKYRKRFFWGKCRLAECAGNNFRPPMLISYINTEYNYLTEEQKEMLILLCPVQHGVGTEIVDENVTLLESGKNGKDDFCFLSDAIKKQSINIIAKGPSIHTKFDYINNFIKENGGITIIINPDPDSKYIANRKGKYLFFINKNALSKFKNSIYYKTDDKIITFQGVSQQENGIYQINLMDLYTESELVFNDGVMWVLNWLYKIGFVHDVNIAGFDGSDEDGITSGTKIWMFRNALIKFRKKYNINFLTDTIYI